MGVPEIVFQPVKITSADFVPKLVFQPVKITSADSAGQCYKKLYKEPYKENLNEELYKELCKEELWKEVCKELYKELNWQAEELLMGVPEIVFQPVKITSGRASRNLFSSCC